MLKVLIIRTNSISIEPRVEKEAESLSNNGYNVTVLGWDRSCKYPKREKRGNYFINRIYLSAPYGKPLLVLKMFVWFWLEFKYLLMSDYDIAHPCDLDTLIPAVIVSKIRRKAIIYDCFDFYSDSLPEKVPSIIRHIIAGIEIFFSQFVDIVILVDESRKKQFRNKLKKNIILNNTPREISDKKSNPQQNTDFNIFYGGILDVNRGLDKLIEATKDLDGLELVIAGYDVGYDLSEILKNNQNVNFVGKIPYEEVIKRTKESDMIFALYDPKIRNHKYASPNKLFEAMMCGKPILTNYGTSMAKIVSSENCGVLVDYENVKDIKNAIIQLRNDPKLRRNLGKNGLKAYKTKYNWDIMEKRLLDTYKLLYGQCM